MAAEQAAGGSNEQLFLYIGLTNGVCQRVRTSINLNLDYIDATNITFRSSRRLPIWRGVLDFRFCFDIAELFWCEMALNRKSA